MILKLVGTFIIFTLGFLGVRTLLHEGDIVEQKETKTVIQQPSENSPLLPTQNASDSQTETEQTPEEVLVTPPTYTASSLATFDGTDETKPIYIAIDGNVYDVTEGKKFYAPGGVYHFLAGTDGTTLLKVMGGDIIKKKYPVVGIFAP